MPDKIIAANPITLGEVCNLIRKNFCKHILYILEFTEEAGHEKSMPHRYDLAVEVIIYGIARTVNRKSTLTLREIENEITDSSFFQFAKALENTRDWPAFVASIKKSASPYGGSPRLLFTLGSGHLTWKAKFEIPPPIFSKQQR